MSKLTFIPAVLLLLGVVSCGSENQKNAAQPATADALSTKTSITDTGQNVTYSSDGIAITTEVGDAFFGQDADYQDQLFNFQKSPHGMTVHDLNTHLTWQHTPPDEKFSWGKAKAYCENLTLAENDKWRLPSLKELMSIQDFQQGWPYLDTSIFSIGKQSIGKHLQYWSSNFYLVGTTHGGAETAFGLNYGTGHIKGYPTGDGKNGVPPPRKPSGNGPEGVKSKTGLTGSVIGEKPPGAMPPPPRGARGGPRGNPAHKLVRCVSGAEYGKNKFVDNGDGTISDLATGLMWLKQDSEKGLDWEHALKYAQTLEFAGYDDWKLPNVKELQSIVDYSGVYPAIDQNYFSITDKDAYFWSSTSAYFSKFGSEAQQKYYWAWYVAFGYAVGPDGKDSHGAGAVRYDSKAKNGPVGEDAERVFNYARAVRKIQ